MVLGNYEEIKASDESISGSRPTLDADLHFEENVSKYASYFKQRRYRIPQQSGLIAPAVQVWIAYKEAER